MLVSFDQIIDSSYIHDHILFFPGCDCPPSTSARPPLSTTASSPPFFSERTTLYRKPGTPGNIVMKDLPVN